MPSPFNTSSFSSVTTLFFCRFFGFASEAQTEPTVEVFFPLSFFPLFIRKAYKVLLRTSIFWSSQSEVFKALERARLLVSSRKESCYSRCGRTDKGVSATGQVTPYLGKFDNY